MTKKSSSKRKQTRRKNDLDKSFTMKLKSNSSTISKDNLLVAATVVGIAYLAFPLFIVANEPMRHEKIPILTKEPVPQEKKSVLNAKSFRKSFASTIEERLLEEWHPGDSIAIEGTEAGNRSLFATKNIRKGEVIARVKYPDLAGEITREYPALNSIVKLALAAAIEKHSAARHTTITSGKVLSCLKLILEASAGEGSLLHSFIESMPRNVTNLVWYWSEDEKQCVVPRPLVGNNLEQDRQVFHSTMKTVKEACPPLAEIYTIERVDWGYIILQTRGFDQFFVPLLELANHNPMKAVPAFIIPSSNTVVYVATDNIQAGDQVYATYGSLSPVKMAEQYGFVDPAAAFFESPKILQDILRSNYTMNDPLCNSKTVKFFGNVPTVRVGATFMNVAESTYFKAFMPDERSYACIRVLLQTERDPDVAGYIAQKLEKDYNQYKEMEDAPHCQSDDGNFPLIRQANQVMARLLWGALDTAKQGRDSKIAYPGIPTYISNYT